MQLRFGFCKVEWIAGILHDTESRFVLVNLHHLGDVKTRFGFPE